MPGATVNRLCGSSLDAAMQASRAIETGDASVVLVGGVESMSRAPWVLLKPERGYARTNQELYSTTLGWRMVNPEMPEQWTISLGASAEKLARDPRHLARGAGRVRGAQPPARGGRLGRGPLRRLGRPGARTSSSSATRASGRTRSTEKLATLKPAFAKDGTVTAGNASPLNDGAGALLLGDEAAGAAIGREPLARIAGRGTAGVDPDVFGIAPVEAAEPRARAGRHRLGRRRRRRAQRGVRVADARLPEGLAGARPGASSTSTAARSRSATRSARRGVRILATLAHELRRRGGGYGVASICIGVGQGLAVVLEA